MRTRWPIVVLAIGLGALHVAISIRFGPGIASALVAGIGIAYAAFNLLVGKPKDDPGARVSIARLMAVSKVTYAAIALVWLSVVALAAYPIIDQMRKKEFTITVVDEDRRPVDAVVEVRIGAKRLKVPIEKGIGTVIYYPSAAVRSAQILVDNKGILQSVDLRADAEGHFANVVIPIWTGEPPLSVAHFTVSGVAIDAFLHGELPPDLVERYPRVTVIRTPVFDSVKEFLSIYRDFKDSEDNLDYSRSETGVTGGKSVKAHTETNGGDAWLQAYRSQMMKLKLPTPLSADFDLDFSTRLFGASVDQPLPEGFLAYLQPEAEWSSENQAIPDAGTDAWIRSNLKSVGHGPNGAVSLNLERLFTVDDINYVLKNRIRSGDGFEDTEADAYLRYMIRHSLPEGLIRAAVNLDSVYCDGGQTHPSISLYLPEPKMRFTLLKNITDKPVKIDSLLLTLQARDKLQRAGQAAPEEESKIPFDVLAPGEAILIPRELSIEAAYSDSEIAQFHKPATKSVGTFRLLPRLPREVFGTKRAASSVAGFYDRPRQLKIPLSHLLQQEIVIDDASEGEDLGQKGATYLVGPSTSEIDYVVNGVKIRARSDRRQVLAMIGWSGMEMGSCPFVFAQYSSAPRPLNLGQIIANQVGIGAKGPDRVSIPAGFTRLEIRERENEISYLDSATLRVKRPQGYANYNARNPMLGKDDGRYAILRKGDLVTLNFGYVPRAGDGEVMLEVNGYYDRVHPEAEHAKRQSTASLSRR